jgi:hypothetical protein
MRRFYPACAILLLAGCGVTGHVEVTGPAPAPAPAIVVTDARPAADRAGGTRTGPGGRLHQFGDAALAPAPPELLARALAARNPAAFAGRQVELQEFTVTVLDPAVRLPDGGDMATGAITAGGVAAVLGYGVIAGIEHSRSRKTLTVRIAGLVDGQPFAAGRSTATRGRVTGRRLARLVGDTLAEAAARAAAVAAAPAPAMLTGG